MLDIQTYLQNLHRPKILIKTARIGAKNYNRSNHLSKVVDVGVRKDTQYILEKLLEIETEQNAMRLSLDASYSVIRHINVMIAIVAEARFLRAS